MSTINLLSDEIAKQAKQELTQKLNEAWNGFTTELRKIVRGINFRPKLYGAGTTVYSTEWEIGKVPANMNVGMVVIEPQLENILEDIHHQMIEAYAEEYTKRYINDFLKRIDQVSGEIDQLKHRINP